MKKFLTSSVFTLVFTSTVFAAEKTTTETSVAPAPIFTQSKPAVDGLNGELWFYGGAGMGNAISTTPITGLSISREETGRNFQGISGVTGVLTAPLGHSFGVQFDLSAGTFEKAVQGSAATHLFWRNPDQALVGIYGSGQYWAGKGGRMAWNIGPEVEKYFDNVTIGGVLGLQGFSFSSVTWDPSIPIERQQNACNHQPNRFFDNVSVKYYPTDDLMVKVGHTYTKGDNAITAGAEYIPQEFRGGNSAASFFVNGAYGWDKGSMVLAGLKVYFGNHDKSLKRRHREDDPMGSTATIAPSCNASVQEQIGTCTINGKTYSMMDIWGWEEQCTSPSQTVNGLSCDAIAKCR